MKKLFTLLLAFAIGCGLSAKPISPGEAKTAATRYLDIIVGCTDGSLSLCETLYGDDSTAALYVFNIADQGFIVTSAHTFAPPVIGWSMNGAFCRDSLAPALLDYIEDYRHDIAAMAAEGRHSETGSSYPARPLAEQEWAALLSPSGMAAAKGYYASQGAKSQAKLLTTTWNQGAGYNNLCPTGPDGKRAVTGCVATAMAQIIRYHRYPEHGFGTSSYAHMVYGRLTAVHDSVTYDYSSMPNSVNERSQQAYQDAVSLLCFHCGVSVNMDYQSNLNTSGSGAFVTDVPESIQHFGYFRSYFRYKADMGDSLWHLMVRRELDPRRPILYQGHSPDGGHAFVCDGYNERDNTYHFNWGWGGHGDGFYTLTTMREFTVAQGGVFGIYPSGLLPGYDTLYVQPSSNPGDGTTWYNATNDIVSAIRARGIYKSGEVWVREGRYYGDSIEGNEGCIYITHGVKVYGGFAGIETSLDERNIARHPTIFDGRGKRRVVYAQNINKEAKLADVQIVNGVAETGAGLYAGANLVVNNCTISYCMGTNGSAIYSRNSTLRNCVLVNNSGAYTLSLNRSSAKNMLIANNNGGGCFLDEGKMVGCDIVSNNGLGVEMGHWSMMRNCIVWNNDGSLSGDYNPDSVHCCAFSDGTHAYGGNISLSLDNYAADGPHFVYATPRGPHTRSGDWHLTAGSPCIDAGDTTRGGSYATDLDGTPRLLRQGIDIGCYEYVGNTQGINSAAAAPLAIYPNPCNGTALCEGVEAGSLLRVYDITGRCLYTATASSGTATLHMPSKGLYIVRSSTGKTAHLVVK